MHAPGLSSEIDGLQVRGATTDDALCLSALAMQVFLETYATEGIGPKIAREVLSAYSEASFTRAIASLEASSALQSEKEIASASLKSPCALLTSWLAPAGEQTELRRLYVQEPFTAQHVGSQLLVEAERNATRSGATVLWLTPWVHNHRALAFYGRRRYTDYGLTRFLLEDERHENRVYAKLLPMVGAA